MSSIKWILTIVATLIAAGVIGSVGVLAGHGERLAVVETTTEAHIEADGKEHARIDARFDKIEEAFKKTMETHTQTILQELRRVRER
jgi:hypothetical protein